MASRPYFDKSKGAWYIKWKTTIGPGGWAKARLCPHPGWTKGDPIPKRPPADATRIARVWEDKEAAVKSGESSEPSRPITLTTFIDDYTLTSAAGQTPGSMRYLRRACANFVAWCHDRKVEHVSEVTADVCRRYLAERLRTVAHATAKGERATLSPAWSQAFQDGRVKANPWARAPVPGKPRQDHPPSWTKVEVATLAAACKPWLADVVIVGAYTGLRITSLLGLAWDDVDFAKGTVRVRAGESKSGRTYQAPMLGPARDVLERRRFLSDKNPLVFPGPRLGRRMRDTTTYKRIKTAVGRSGVPDHGRYNHILRHCFGTWTVNGGVPLKVVSEWMGHSSIAMTMRYAHHDSKESARWVDHFDSGGGSRP